MEKRNIAEMLKDCPKGMELDCTMLDNVVFEKIDFSSSNHSIIIRRTESNKTIHLTRYGQYSDEEDYKCIIFPKGKTTWEGFQRPFKDGDIIFTHANCLKVGVGNTWISIFKEKRNGGVATYVDYAEDGRDYYSDLDGDKALLCMEEDILRQRFATEEEKQKLFDSIKANGYKWNAETKTLEDLIVPKFKVGDRIKEKRSDMCGEIIDVQNNRYDVKIDDKGLYVYFREQNDWELLPHKFNITTLESFESRVLVRTSNHKKWVAAFYSHYDKDSLLHHCVVGGLWYEQCIPYNDETKHLLNTTNNCDEYYKNW